MIIYYASHHQKLGSLDKKNYLTPEVQINL